MTPTPISMLGFVIALAGLAAAAGSALLAAGQGKLGQALLLASYVLLAPGLVGLYASQADRLGKAGHAGFHLSLLGVVASMPLAGVLTLGHFGVPEAVALVRSGALLPFGMAGDYALLLGLGALAAATAKAGVLPRAAAAVLGGGVLLLVLAQLMVLPMLTWIGGVALNAVAFCWMGRAMVAPRRADPPASTTAA